MTVRLRLFLRLMFLIAVPGICLFAQPRIKVIGKTEFSFGKMYTGASATRRVKVTNVGTDPLEITNLDSPCGCSTLEINRKILLPKDTAVVSIRFNSDKFIGQVHKSVYVVSNDPHHITTTLSFSAVVLTLMSVDPAFLSFSHQENLDDVKKSIRLTNISRKKVTILSVFDPTSFTDLVFTPKTLSPGDTFSIGVSAKPVGEMGRSGEIIVKTNSREQPIFKIDYFVEGLKQQ